MRPWHIWLTILAAIIIALTAVELENLYFASIQVHQQREEDKATIVELLDAIKEDNPSTFQLSFSSDKEGKVNYDILFILRHDPESILKEPCLALGSQEHNKRKFKKVSRKIIEIFDKEGFVVKAKKIDDRWSKLYQVIEIYQDEVSLQQCRKILEHYLTYFWNFNHWSTYGFPDLKGSGSLFYFREYGVK